MTQRVNAFTVAHEGVAALIRVETYLKSSGLEPSLLPLIKTRVSQMNGCAYCLHMHTLEAREAGVDETKLYLLNAWHESALYTPRERAALNWAESLTNIAETHAPDEAYQEARFEFTERELIDLSIAIAMINAWNRLAIGMRAEHPADYAQAA